ncbi:OPA3-domain-containing protein [Schizopora paradoxa]|uniref:OPA3-domain-containing protein n=1 Tax=Schizopora paradoxa TaxID=27342 RepID=A0A0H2SD44_9AGAM|nr:OPA3-domain-containing protein [Schizopora paradoxa]
MASTKLLTLVVRTLAKPISNRIKQTAKEHETFRSMCVSLAQRMHRGEVQLRTNILGEPPKSIRPLSEAKAIDSGANAIAEGFLFGVAALLIIGESYRSSRSQAKRRDVVDDQIDDLKSQVQGLSETVKKLEETFEERWTFEQHRNDELNRVLNRMVDVGLRSGWSEFEDTPIRIPKVEIRPQSTLGSDSPAEKTTPPEIVVSTS